MGFVTTATFDVSVLRTPLFPLSYLWDLHSMRGSPNWGMQCKYPETRAIWKAVPMWHDVVRRGSSLSFGSGVTILSPLLYQGKHNLLRTEFMKSCYLVALWNFWCIRKIKLKLFSWPSLKADQKLLLGILYIYMKQAHGKYLSFWNSCFFIHFTQQHTIVLHEGKILHKLQLKRRRLLVPCHISLSSTFFCAVLKQGQLKFYIAFPGKCQEARKCNVTSLLILYPDSHRTKGN